LEIDPATMGDQGVKNYKLLF